MVLSRKDSHSTVYCIILFDFNADTMQKYSSVCLHCKTALRDSDEYPPELIRNFSIVAHIGNPKTVFQSLTLERWIDL